jgi:copper chaperone CopZ
MAVYRFKTNIKCSGCVSKVKPFLNQTEEICHWNIDLEDQDKILSLTSKVISANEIIQIIKKAGYKAQKIK